MTDHSLIHDARRYWAMIHKRRAIVFTCLGVSLLVAIVYNYTSRPVYQATAQILIDRDTPKVLPNKELVDIVQAGSDYYQTQYQLLRGRMLAERVVERLDLQRSDEFRTGPMLSPWERLQVRILGKPPKSTVDSDGMPLSPAVAAFRSRVTVEPVPGSRLVNLRFSAYDPGLAAQAVNALAELYIKQTLEFRFTISSEATGWLGDRLKEQQEKVQAAEKALQQYREKEGLVNPEERQSLVDQKLQALNLAVLNARTERIAKETVWVQLRNLPLAAVASFPSVMANPVVQGLKSQLADLHKDEARLADSIGDKHPDMIKVRSEIRANEDKLRSEMRSVVQAAEADYRTAASQEASLQQSLDAVKQEAMGVNRKAIEYGVLRREVDGNQQIYKDLLTRTKQTGLETELETTNIRVVEKAEVPRAPISPQRVRNYQLGTLVGLLLGIGLVLIFEHFDNTLKTPEDVKEQLGLPFLGMVPDVGVRQTPANATRAGGGLATDPEEPTVGGRRVVPGPAHEPDLLVRGQPGTGPRHQQRQPGRGQDDDCRQPRLFPGPERRQGAGRRRRLAPTDHAQPLRDPQDARALRPDRGKVPGLPGDPGHEVQGPPGAALRVRAPEPRRAPGLGPHETGHRGAPHALRVGPHRHAPDPRHGRHAGALSARGRGHPGDRGRGERPSHHPACRGPDPGGGGQDRRRRPQQGRPGT